MFILITDSIRRGCDLTQLTINIQLKLKLQKMCEK